MAGIVSFRARYCNRTAISGIFFRDDVCLRRPISVVGMVRLEVLAKPVHTIVVLGVAIDRVDVAC